MAKHIYFLALILSLTSFIGSLLFNKEAFTVFGWFSATASSFTALVYFKKTQEADK